MHFFLPFVERKKCSVRVREFLEENVCSSHRNMILSFRPAEFLCGLGLVILS